MNNVKISFIVPVFKVQEYLAYCLDSIFAQNIDESEFEIICIDDCSPDDSITILEEYASRHKNIKIIRFSENKGQSSARNAGISTSLGRYLWFVDSDDFLPSNVANILLSKAETDNLDVLLFNYERLDEDLDNILERSCFHQTETEEGLPFVKSVFGNSFCSHFGYVWRLLLKREFVIDNDMFFPEGETWEDTVYFPKCFLEAKRVACVDVVGYCYRANPNSISMGGVKSMTAKSIYDYCLNVGVRLLEYSERYESIDYDIAFQMKEYAISRYFNSLFRRLIYSHHNEIGDFFVIWKQKMKSGVRVPDQTISINRYILVYPLFGRVICHLGHIAYQIKKTFLSLNGNN